MNMILRNFFCSFGLAMLLACWSMNPDTAQFKDVLALLHVPNFWQIVGSVAASLIGLEVVLGGGFSGPSATACFSASGKAGNLAQDYWKENADKLAADLANCDPEFVASASLNQITEKAGAWFAALSEKNRESIMASMRAGAALV